MLPKKLRLSRPDILRVKSQGTNSHFPHFSVVYNTSPLGTNRYSVITSAKLHKRAVVRNRLRRLIYNILRTSYFALSTDVIIYPRPSMLNLSREEVSTSLNQALSKIAASHS